MKIKTIASFFAGVGGIDFAFEQLKNYKVIYANEFDKNARKTYESNFNIKVDPRDIRDVDIKEIPKTDILLAGFPCQAFSVAGYRKGFEDRSEEHTSELQSRGHLVCRLLPEKKKVREVCRNK